MSLLDLWQFDLKIIVRWTDGHLPIRLGFSKAPGAFKHSRKHGRCYNRPNPTAAKLSMIFKTTNAIFSLYVSLVLLAILFINKKIYI